MSVVAPVVYVEKCREGVALSAAGDFNKAAQTCGSA